MTLKLAVVRFVESVNNVIAGVPAAATAVRAIETPLAYVSVFEGVKTRLVVVVATHTVASLMYRSTVATTFPG